MISSLLRFFSFCKDPVEFKNPLFMNNMVLISESYLHFTIIDNACFMILAPQYASWIY